ncbi:hypothetical protein [Blastomonas sp.]|uniref:hypothetical protein n=1 Tax=Blastomonas sp. TaxID=1909299 RepID=UPI0035945749
MNEYPNHVVALAVVRHPSEPADRGQPPRIYSIGAFTCERLTDWEARFTETHVAFASDDPSCLPLAHVKSLLRRDSHVVTCAPAERHTSRRTRKDLDFLLPGTEELPRARRRIFRASDERLSQLGWQFDLELNHEDATVLQQARSAARRAQAAWLTSVAATHDLPTKSALLTSYRAWRIIQNAMPIRF